MVTGHDPPSPDIPPALASVLDSPVSILAPTSRPQSSSPPPPPHLSSSPPSDSAVHFPDRRDPPLPDPSIDIYDDFHFDDEALSALEKIYLLSRSKAVFHRVFISRSLHTFLTQVSPLEAVEYVIPLLNALATDQEPAVKEALVTDLVEIMWWFFENCSLVQDEPPDEPHDPPLLPVQTFTPILGSLLIDLNAMVCGPARLAVVESLNRLHAADAKTNDNPLFGPNERQMLRHEIIHEVIIGMGKLDVPLEISHLSLQSQPASSSQQASYFSTEITELPPPPVPLVTPALLPVGISFSPEPLPLQSPPSQEPVSLAHFTPTTPSSTQEISAHQVPQPPRPTSETALENRPADEGSVTREEVWMYNCDHQEDAAQAAVGRCSSMSLIATVTANTTLPEETTHAFTSEVLRVCKDSFYWVRREATFALGALAKVVSLELLELSILPLFDALTHDPLWHVRHSAIFALPGILARLTPQHRRMLALDTLLAFSRDDTPTVRSGVLEVLGEVIYTFHEDDGGAPAELVALFVDDAWYSKKSTLEDGEDAYPDPPRALVTSFNYPAVALSLGPQRWAEVREYYLSLVRDTNMRVRRTIAAGLGEMARLLGAVHAQRDLVGVWEALVHDAEDGETRLRALRGVELFVGSLDSAARVEVVSGLVDLWERWLWGWRERECLAQSLAGLAELVGGHGGVVRTLLRKALVDTAAAVREAAINAVPPILIAFEDRPHLVDAVRDDLQSLASAELSRRRATYVACYCSLVGSKKGEAEIARDDFWECIIPLSEDTIVDVRIGVARLLGEICDKYYPNASSRPPYVSQVLSRLGRDPSRDVHAFVEFLLVPVPKGRVESQEIPYRPRPVIPPVLFATFSRPPPAIPPLNSMKACLSNLGFGEGHDDFKYADVT